MRESDQGDMTEVFPVACHLCSLGRKLGCFFEFAFVVCRRLVRASEFGKQASCAFWFVLKGSTVGFFWLFWVCFFGFRVEGMVVLK